MSYRLFRVLACLVGLFCVRVEICQAHDPGLSSARIAIRSHEVEVQVLFAPSDLQAWMGEVGSPLPPLAEWRVGKNVVSPLRIEMKTSSPTTTEFNYTYPKGAESSGTYRCLILDQLPFGHRQLVTGNDGVSALQSHVLTAAQNAAEIPLRAPQAGVALTLARPTFAGFFQMGIEHILTGYDHLLFLCALLLVCERFRSAVTIITCFTMAHSISLALATFHLVNLPSRVVEPLIAVSIVYVGIENLLVRRSLGWRAGLTFGFGLIHGLGFASALQEVGIGSDGGGVALPLFSFNLGVEVGQISVALVIFPLVVLGRRWSTFVSRGVPTFSSLIAGAGAYWFIERVLT